MQGVMRLGIDISIDKIDKADINPDDVLVLKIPVGIYSLDVTQSIFECIQECFPYNKCVMIPDDLSIQLYNHTNIGIEPATTDELFKFLNIENAERTECDGR